MKKALITGITGQDGSYLAELLLDKGYEVYGLVRRASQTPHNLKLISHLLDRVTLESGDLSDPASIFGAVVSIKPDEIYNLGAITHVHDSFAAPAYTVQVNGIAPILFLEAILKVNPKIKFYQASTSELYGDNKKPPFNEFSEFLPVSPYADGKYIAHRNVKRYRETKGLFAVSGILFNHESPRRGEDFLTRKVTVAVARIKAGLQDKLELGNLDPKRDWGHARDYVEAMWTMLQQDTPRDYAIGTGECHTVREWVDAAFSSQGLNYKDYVVPNPKFMRPTEIVEMYADYSTAEKYLGWKPKTKFNELVAEMVAADMKLFQ